MTRNVKMGVYIRKTTDGEVQTPFNFYTNLRATEKMKFVNEVTNLVLTDNYYTVIKDMIFDYIIINIFTDVDISEINEAPDSINRIETLLEETNIVDIVKANMADGLLVELEDAVEKNIEYRTGIHNNSLTDSISKLLKTIEKKIDGVDTQNMMDLATKLNGLSGELTVDKLVEAYSHTDAAQKYQTELAERRERQNGVLDAMNIDPNVIDMVSQRIKEGR